MGCDIHMMVQVRKGDGWETVKWPNPYYGKYEWEKDEETPRAYDNRNYEAFAILAGVRDRFGITPISEPRGWPEGFSPEDEESDEYSMGDHSFTWLGLEEVLAFDWTQIVTMSGLITGSELIAIKTRRDKKPYSYCQGTSGKTVSLSVLEKMVSDPNTRLGEVWGTYALFEWEETYAECADDFYAWLPKLQALGKPEDVRLVMGFDS